MLHSMVIIGDFVSPYALCKKTVKFNGVNVLPTCLWKLPGKTNLIFYIFN